MKDHDAAATGSFEGCLVSVEAVPETTNVASTARPGLAANLLLAAVGLVGALSLVQYVRSFGTNVPIGDDWDLFRTLLSWRTDGFTMASLLAFQDEHRIVATRAIYGIFLPWVDGNVRAALLLDVSFVIATLAIVFAFVRRAGAHPLFLLFGYAAVVALFVGRYQWQTLLSLQLPWLLLPLLLVAAIWTLCHVASDVWCFVLVVLLCLAAWGCQANGIVVWIAIVPAVLLRCAKQSVTRRAVIAAGIVVLAMLGSFVYFIDQPSAVVRPSIGAALGDPLRLIHFFLAVLGSPFSAPLALAGPETTVGVVAGGAGVVAAVVALIRLFRIRPAPVPRPIVALATGLMLFGALSVLAISLGNFPRFAVDSIESRDSTFALDFYVGLVLLFLVIATRDLPPGRKTGSLRVAFLAVCIATIVAAHWGDVAFEQHGTNMLRAQSRFKASLQLSRALPGRPELVGEIHTVPIARLSELLDGLEQHRLWTPRRIAALARADLQTVASIGNVDGQVASGDRVVLRGWTRLPDGLPADAVIALVPRGNDIFDPVAISDAGFGPRPDVVAAFAGASVGDSGWRLELSGADYALHPILVAYTARGEAFYALPFEAKPLAADPKP